MLTIDFDTAFKRLTGNTPFPWQRRLFERFIAGDWPESCNLPTGLGKSSIITIWLLALAHARIAGTQPLGIPRRLVYVVNRRTVVDQSTTEAQELLEKLEPKDGQVDPALNPVRDALRSIAGSENDACLAISTLRGQFADNGEWRSSPTRPAIIVGTVDMIGSRLLFSGYGCGFKTRPLHAGFLGHDVLLVHDEAHLEPAFQSLIKAIETEQLKERQAGLSAGVSPFRTLELTATSRAKQVHDQFILDDADRAHVVVRERLSAKKSIVFHSIEDDRTLAEKAAELALVHGDSGKAILIYLRRVEDVGAVVSRLEKAHPTKVETLTGTIRGYERDRLATENRPETGDSVFARFLPPPSNDRLGPVRAEGTVFLVCTSAGEVGVNISADHLVCDLTPFESMAQRFGRANRFGQGNARIDVIHPERFDAKDALAAPREKTLALLRSLPSTAAEGHDASPHALGQILAGDRQAAFTPAPEILSVDGILFDAWAMTTIRPPQTLPGRPPVTDWLHGVTDRDPPETHVAWRDDVEWLSPGPDENQLKSPRQRFAAELLEDYPLKPHELLRDRSDRVLKRIEKLASAAPNCPAWLLSADGTVEFTKLGALVDPDESEKDVLNWKTLLLPVRAGGLNRQGMLADGPPPKELDVADEWFLPIRSADGSDDAGADNQEKRQRRKRIVDGDSTPRGMRRVMTFVPPLTDDEPDDESDDEGDNSPKVRHWCVRPKSADDEGSWSSSGGEQRLADHLKAAGDAAEGFCRALGLDDTLSGAVALAARCHDLGKNRALWQTSIGNREYPGKVLAKSGSKTARPPLNEHYRHEFGSLLDLEAVSDFSVLPHGDQELCRHLIAAHHGRARPHFPPDEAFDPGNADEAASHAATAVPQRFARLQRAFGRWGLAWLESLVRAADYRASDLPSPSSPPEEGDAP